MKRLAKDRSADEAVSEKRVDERVEGEPSSAEIWVPDAEEELRVREAVRIGIEQADRGEFIEEEEMDARVERMLSSL